MNPQIVSTIGLVFDAVGVLIVLIYAWPQPKLENKDSLLIERSDQPSPELDKKRTTRLRMSMVGLIFLLSGFGIQIIATWL